MNTSLCKISDAHIITCPKCYNVFKQPVSLRCSHSYCLGCVERMLTEDIEGGFMCLLCFARQVDVSEENAKNLVNEELQHFIVSLVQGVRDRVMCWRCEDVPAVLVCSECTSAYCDDCSRAVHNNVAFRAHVVEALDPSSIPKDLSRRCSVPGHEESKAKFFCNDCSVVCCSACLQSELHHDHIVVDVGRAAAIARRETAGKAALLEVKRADVLNHAQKMDCVTTQYVNSYENVETWITERFNYLRQELAESERHVRDTLASIRSDGDECLMSSRRDYLSLLDTLNKELLRISHLTFMTSDYEALERNVVCTTSAADSVLSVRGNGFEIAYNDHLSLPKMSLRLDLQASVTGDIGGSVPQKMGVLTLRTSSPDGLWPSSRSLMVQETFSAVTSPSPPPDFVHLTFSLNSDVKATVLSEGVRLHCAVRGEGPLRIGVRSNESLSTLCRTAPSDRCSVPWSFRLDCISDTFVGVVDVHPGKGALNGVYWKPGCAHVYEGSVGRFTSAMGRLPVCKNGDVIQFLYEVPSFSLRIMVNGRDYGVAVTNLPTSVAPCFVFFPGESLTMLH